MNMKQFDESLSEQSEGWKGPRVNNQGRPEVEVDEDASTGRDIHHDPWLMPGSLDLQTLATSIFEELEASFPRPPRQRSDAKARRVTIVGNIVSSLALLTRYHPEGARLAIIAENTKRTRYDRAVFSREVFMQIVSEMEGAGYLLRHKGTRRKARTTIEPSTRFHLMVSEMEVQICRTEGAETIVLKAGNGRDRPKVFIDYQDTTETIAMRAEMQAVNNALGSASITVAGEPSSIPPFMTRRFQIDSPDAPHTFHQHGRLYGGLWQSLPKTERHLLRVEGEQVADLDFTGMFVQLAYLEAGLALPNSDPYVGVEGLPRTAMKLGISALLCRSGAMRRLPTEISDIVGSKWNARRFSAALAERHPSIAHLFGKGLGLRLMKIEGDILLVALQELFAQGVPALPMHDGIMVPASKSEAARRAMARASMKIVGVALPVAQKAVQPDAENANSPPME